MHLREVEKKLREFVPSTKNKTHFEPVSYIGTGFLILGLSSPIQRSVFKSGYSFSNATLEDQLTLWEEIWNTSNVFEVMSQALLFPEKYAPKFETKKLFSRLITWIDKVDSWPHSDMFSSIFARMLEKEPEYVFKQLAKWNTSKNAWERRQSLVPLAIYFKRKGNTITFSQAITLIQPLIPDKDYFVQKGIGWTLRELGVGYPNETWKFLKTHCKEISPVAFTATIEKLSLDKKDELKGMRRKNKG